MVPFKKLLGIWLPLHILTSLIEYLMVPFYSFGNMAILTHLNLSNNKVDGSIPESFGNMTALTYCNLSYNQLKGSILESFKNMATFKYLNISHNQFNGSILEFFGIWLPLHIPCLVWP